MQKLVPAFAMILGWALTTSAAQPTPLTSLSAIHALTNEEASQSLPVAFEATVTFYRGYDKLLFVQDGDTAIFVQPRADFELVAGDRVLVQGRTRASFRPYIFDSTVTRLRHGDLPKSVPANFDQLIRSELDCRLVTVHGIVRAVDLGTHANMRSTYIQILAEGGYIGASVEDYDETFTRKLLDAEVEVTGASSGQFDRKMQQIGSLLRVTSIANVKILKPAPISPWSLPVTPMDEILTTYHVHDATQRVRVHGTVTYYQPGSAIVLQDGAKSLWIATEGAEPLRIGEIVDATGFPEVHDGFLTLTRAEIQDSHFKALLTPFRATWSQLAAKSGSDVPNQTYRLVSIEGLVIMAVREAAQDEYVLVSGGQLFSAIYRHPDVGDLPQSPMKEIPLGSRANVVGICMPEGTNPFGHEAPFNILMRSPDDIALVARPSLLNVRNLVIAMGFMVLIVLVMGTRAWFIEHRVRRQTTAMAYVERRRSRILEEINGSRPLTEIIDQITELVSFKLKGAPCWCQIGDGAKLGNCPIDLAAMRVVCQEITSPSGPPLGKLFAAFDRLVPPRGIETESLSVAAGLAALAIETRRLYSDLRRRSEYDLLTDIHNRFSLDKRLDAQIEEACQTASIFGLIYIDLDNFKRVNDVHGHQVGDLYLQEVATRMKGQLRTHDSLARLGGDEFAVLVPVVRSRVDVQEIALRLERSFDAPFPVNGAILHPAASIGIALYPEDAITKDGLLSAADVAMYVAKNRKRQVAEVVSSPANRPHRS